MGMRFYVAVTDDAWFHHLHALDPPPDEVNFWTGAPATHDAGTPWLFKLHAPHNFIVGGGYFTYYTKMPLAIVWEAFGQLNGVDSLGALQQNIGQYRKEATSLMTPIGCAVLSQPFFLIAIDGFRYLKIGRRTLSRANPTTRKALSARHCGAP